MNTLGGQLEFEFDIQLQTLNSKIEEIERKLGGMTKSVETQGSKIDTVYKRVGAAIAGYFSIQAMAGFAGQIVRVRGGIEQLSIAFETMLGGKEKSDQLMKEITKTAAETPFTLTQVASGAKQLLAFQVSQDKVIDTLVRLGNVASGVSVPIDRLILAYGQVKAKGKLMGDDLRQFTEAGIPMIHELAKAMGVADNQVTGLVESGKIGFPQVEQVIKNLTDEGGMFFNLMEKQSKSTTGMVSNMGDAWDRLLNKIGGTGAGDSLRSGISSITNILTTLEEGIKSTSDVYTEYKDNLANTQTKVRPLLQEYDQLKSKTSLTKDEQTRLNEVIAEIGKNVPTAITQFGKYGEALEINTGKVEDYIRQQKALAEYMNRESIKEAEAERKSLEKQKNAIMSELNAGGKTVTTGMGQYSTSSWVEFNAKDLSERQAKVNELQVQIDKLNGAISGLKGEFLDLGSQGESINPTLETQITYFENLKKAIDGRSSGNGDTTSGLLAKARESLKAYKDELEKAPSEAMILYYEKEIEKTQALIDNYEKLLEVTRAREETAQELPKIDPLSVAGSFTSVSRSLPQNKIIEQTKKEIHELWIPINEKTQKAIDAVSQIRERNVSEYEKMQNSLEALDQTYHDSGLQKDKAYYNERTAIVAGYTAYVVRSFAAIADAVAVFDEKAAQQIANIGNATVSMMEGIASGNFVQAAAGGFQLITSLGDALVDATWKGVDFEKEQRKIQDAIERTAELFKSLEGESGTGYYTDYYKTSLKAQKEIADANNQIAKYQANIAKAEEKKKINAASVFSPFAIGVEIAEYKKAKKEISQNEDLIKQQEDRIKKLKEDLKQAEEQFRVNLTGTTTSSLADAIVEGFKKGESAQQIFANNFKDIMLNAMGQVFERQIIDKMMQSGGFYDQLVKALTPSSSISQNPLLSGTLQGGSKLQVSGTFGKILAPLQGNIQPAGTPQIDQTELDNLSSSYKDALDYGQQLWNTISQVIGNIPGGSASETAISGKIDGVTETTAGMIEGQMNAIRVNILEQMDIATKSMNYLGQIELNTRVLFDIKALLSNNSTMEAMRANGW